MDVTFKLEIEKLIIEETITRGLAQAERGETIDGEEAFRQLRAYAAERRQQRA
jgi:predicted transcriptional regulator